MRITLIGTGFVGVVSAAVYASFGHTIMGLDVDEKKIQLLQQSIVPFFEPNLTELLKEQQLAGNLQFTTDYSVAIPKSEVVIIAVGTPSAPDGQADLKYVLAAARSLAPFISPGTIVAIKSTVPPGTLEKVSQEISKLTHVNFSCASLPEFLREGSAVHDTLNPDRIVIGATDEETFTVLERLHQPFKAPIIKVKPESAQMGKYAANSYLATRITFINQIADLCDKNGANVQEVIQIIGQDQRIGTHYWYPGLGYGGSCFPKDVKELAAYSRAVGESTNLFNKVSELNEQRMAKLFNQFSDQVGGFSNKKVAVLGLSFKPFTDDLREAPATKLIPMLLKAGAQVLSFDPMAHYEPASMETGSYSQVDSIEEAVSPAQVVFNLVEWAQLISFDYGSLKYKQTERWFIDARNQFDPIQLTEIGFKYIGIGRSAC